MEKSDFSWLDPKPAVPPAADDSWLDVKDPTAGTIKLAFQHLIDSCMRGTDRVMACDGTYMAYRPFNREFDKATNPRTRERFADFEAAGHYKHLGTYDEVMIFELEEGSPFRHKKHYVVGANYWGDIRQAAKAACDRNWSDYHDLIGAMATAIKSGGRDQFFAKTMYGDMLNLVAVHIKQMGGPPEREVNEGFIGVRRARGITGGSVIALNSEGLAKMGFDKK